MSGATEYDDYWLDYHGDGAPAQLAARRTRRRRRHGKKPGPDAAYQDIGAPSDEGRGRWLPPPSATTLTLAELGIHVAPPARRDGEGASLTLAQLGIHVPPPALPPKPAVDASRRNVVTCNDLNLLDVGKASPNPGAFDNRNLQPPPPPPPVTPQRHQWQTPGWQCADERPWERILSVPSPQAASNLAASSAMAHHYQVPPPRPQIHPAPTWHADQDPALRHWLSNGQFGAQPIFHNDLGGSGLLLDSTTPVPAANAPQPIFQNDMGSSGMLLDPAPPVLAGPVTVPPMGAGAGSGEDMGQTLNEDSKLETLLEHLAADVYQD